MKWMTALIVVTSVSLGTLLIDRALAAEDGPKHTIAEVMKNAHKDKLLNKVLDGEATQEEKLALLDNYISLIEAAPPKGEMASWQELTGKLALAAGKVAVGREGAAEELKAASNCKACHDAHKGS